MTRFAAWLRSVTGLGSISPWEDLPNGVLGQKERSDGAGLLAPKSVLRQLECPQGTLDARLVATSRVCRAVS
jgi:hypothetical protein